MAEATAIVYMKDAAGNMVEVPVPAKTLAQVKNLQVKADSMKFDKQRLEIAKAFADPINETVEEGDLPAVAGMTLMYDFDRGTTPRLVPTNLINDLRERPRADDGFTWSKPKAKEKKATAAK